LCGGGGPFDPINPNADNHPTACFSDTPNNGGEYKVWVTMRADYLLGCQAQGFASLTGLGMPGCGGKTGGNAHGFIPSHSKTDNFKVRGTILEIDTTFQAPGGNYVDGIEVTWTDSLGASNEKFSYEDLAHDVHHEAHVEAVELGTHYIQLWDQPGCLIGTVAMGPKGSNLTRLKKAGPQAVAVTIDQKLKVDTVFIRVQCK
jgi:hypothetical protein